MPIDETYLILGLGTSGQAAAQLLRAEGKSVCVMDRNDSAALRNSADKLRALGTQVLLGCSTPPPRRFKMCVVSPGIRLDAPEILSAKALGIPLCSELELGWSRAQCRVLAISGSNGKSTLLRLCAAALQHAGLRVATGGNYAPPVSELMLQQRPLDWLALEVSSFQLETVAAFRPHVAVLLNVAPNHLDRHGSMEIYLALKARLFAKMTEQDTGIVAAECLPAVRTIVHTAPRWLSISADGAADFFYHRGMVHNRGHDNPVSIAGTFFDNPVMGLTAAAAAAVLSACGESSAHVAAAARTFKTLPHRMEQVLVARDVRFVDDSKSTNLAALLAALRMTPKPIRLIAGGLSKNEPYEPALPLLGEKVGAAYLIGRAAAIMAKTWRAKTDCRISGSLEHAVAEAWKDAQPGETILLSPGCASFDQFRNFAERGAKFAELARQLTAK